MKLIIVESPTKARTLSRFLGSDYVIEATMGHLRDLPENKMGVEIKVKSGKVKSYDFIPQYELVAKKKETIDKLKEEAVKADSIILATDPDREGEAIAWHVTSLLAGIKNLKLKIKNFDRIAFHEITESAIKEALANPGKIDMNLVSSQQARRVLDRLVGYKLSPLLWRKIRRGLSAGRVQSVTVRLIVEREREIEAFKAEEYWKIIAKLKKESPYKGDSLIKSLPVEFEAMLIKIEIKNKHASQLLLRNKEQAEQIVSELNGLSYKVKNIETSELKKSPYPPFTTSTMQQAAANVLGWTSKRTMQVAQSLYEQGLITYHRTDSLNLAQQAIFSCRDFIEKEYGKNYLPEAPKFYKTKSKVAQEAHEAIRVTKVEKRYQELEISRDEERLYDLIWKRFVACQMNEAVYGQTRVDIEASKDNVILEGAKRPIGSNEDSIASLQNDNKPRYLFRANGSQLKFDGWRKIYLGDRGQGLGDSERNDEETTTGNELPVLTVGELLKLLQLLPTQHFTEPPARFTEATLIKALEEKGIGRPSTYAPIITTIQQRQYVEKGGDPSTSSGRQSRFKPTVLGMTVNDFLVKNFSKIVDIDFTAKMEDDLDKIANGKNQWVPVLSDFYGPFEQKLSSVAEKAKRVAVPVEQTEEKCPQCGSPLIVRIGKFGKFLACSKFPGCKFTKSYVNKTGIMCPSCGKEIILKKTKKGKNFYGCSNYPKCTFAAWKKEEIISPKVDNQVKGS